MPTQKGSWRDKGKGKCYTRVNKAGGKYVVCNDPPRGSRGQAGVYEKKGRGKAGQTDKELLDDFGGYSVKELKEHPPRVVEAKRPRYARFTPRVGD